MVRFAVSRSVISALKLIFPTKHFPNLGKPIICQYCFQIFQGNYKFFEGVYLGEGRLDDHAAKCIRYLEATKGGREVQEFSDEIKEFKRFWVL